MQLIFLHGTAASGKLTTARALEAHLGYPVFHNHLVVDALTTVFPFGSEPFVRLREDFWLQVFTDAARTARSFTFTFAPEATVHPGFPARARARVESSGGRICFVRLVVSEEEQERRISNEDRKQFHKLTDRSTLRRLRNDRRGIEQPPVDLEINTDTTTVEESAALIVGRFQLTPEERRQRYPLPESDAPASRIRRLDLPTVVRDVRK
jgi:chloramphenicol 3-O-phosphotransferase